MKSGMSERMREKHTNSHKERDKKRDVSTCVCEYSTQIVTSEKNSTNRMLLAALR